MGKEKYLNKVMSLFNKSPIVKYDSIKRITKSNYSKQVVRNLLKKGKIKKLAKGCYSIHEDPSLIVFCLQGYLGLQNALSFHRLWEQETVPIIITSAKIRNGIRIINGMNVLVRKIDKKYLFGFEYYKDGDFYFPYSDMEKTFIDLVYFKLHIDKEVLQEFRKKIDRKKLNSYLKRYPKKFREKVLAVMKG